MVLYHFYFWIWVRKKLFYKKRKRKKDRKRFLRYRTKMYDVGSYLYDNCKILFVKWFIHTKKSDKYIFLVLLGATEDQKSIFVLLGATEDQKINFFNQFFYGRVDLLVLSPLNSVGQPTWLVKVRGVHRFGSVRLKSNRTWQTKVIVRFWK